MSTFNFAEFGDEITKTETDVKVTEKYFKYILDDVKFASSKASIKDFIFHNTECIHSSAELTLVLCNQYFKLPPCAVYLDDTKYNKDLFTLLTKKGELVFRTHYVGSLQTTYCFLYKNTFLSFTKTKKSELTNLTVAYPISVTPPLSELEEFRIHVNEEETKIGIIKSTKYGLTVSNLKIETSQTFDIDNYNDDFGDFFDTLTKKLNEKKPGLYLFHGEPGTGKSSAIRHLLGKVKRNFIFIPPQMINQLSTPEFADIITDTNKGSVLILEDAEKALMKRESEDGFSNSTLVSSVLNLTDGLYADLSNIAIIATYNCDRNLIDSALLRKGRMKAEYKFEKLKKEKAQKLMNKLGHKINVVEDMSLADIFNYEEQYTNVDRDDEKKHIGFASRPGF
jgi:hypothetical protein